MKKTCTKVENTCNIRKCLVTLGMKKVTIKQLYNSNEMFERVYVCKNGLFGVGERKVKELEIPF